MASTPLVTVDRALKLVFILAQSPPLSVEAIRRRLGLPLSSAYRYLASLKDEGIVRELPGARYALGPRCVQLGASFQRSYEDAAPHDDVMSDLAQRTGETVALVAPLRASAVCVATVESSYPLRYTFQRGAVAPMLRGASAKSMLPYLPPERVEEMIAASGDLNDEEKEALREQIPRIRLDGYVVSVGEVDRGVWAVGAPVLRPDGALEGAISAIAPRFRVRGREDRVVRLTVEAAQRLSHDLGTELSHAV